MVYQFDMDTSSQLTPLSSGSRDGSHARAGAVLANAAMCKRQPSYSFLASNLKPPTLSMFASLLGERICTSSAAGPALERHHCHIAVAAQRALAASMLRFPFDNERSGGGA